jgi:hypothetical protein
VVLDNRDDWSAHQPTAAQENEFIRRKGIDEYARWHLGIDVEASAETKGAYKFPLHGMMGNELPAAASAWRLADASAPA